jgi:subtilisin family serine protease
MRVLLVCIAISCASARTESRAGARQLRPGQIIVALAAADGAALPDLRRAIAQDYGLVEVGTFLLSSVRLECVVFDAADGQPLAGVLERLGRDPRVELAEENQAFHEQSGDGEGAAQLSYGAAQTHADLAQRSKTGKGIKVAVIDTGVSTAHPGLRARIVAVQNFVDGGETSFASDLHGTAVAGVIAAQRDERVGMLGIAPDAEIIAIKACWYARPGSAKAMCSSWTLAKAIDFAIGAGAQVLNLSLSGPSDELLRRLVEKAQERGTIVVAAAAEEAGAPGFPASARGVIAVVASDARGQAQLPAWTARIYAMVAPGVEILTTVPGSGYDFVSGSSFAAAHVSGVVALLREESPRLSGLEALSLLRSTARPMPGSSPGDRAGLVDACAALGKLMGVAQCP